MDLDQLGQAIAHALPGAVKARTIALGELTLEVAPEQIAQTIAHLKDQRGFRILIDLCGVDWPQRPKRFDVVYHLLSLTENARIRLKVQLAEGETIASIVALHPSANWFERETFDMFGIVFSDHPDMRRILTDYGFSGYPLRKDFPLTGYVEVRYDDELKRVVYQPVQLVQEFRDFDFMSPWEGAKYVLPGDEKAKP